MLLGSFKNSHELRGHLGMVLEHRVLDDDNVPNGKDSGAAIVVLLHLAIVRP
jgi:hypothetical protein